MPTGTWYVMPIRRLVQAGVLNESAIGPLDIGSPLEILVTVD